MADAAQIETEELDYFLAASPDEQIVAVTVHMSLALVFSLSQALYRRFGDGRWEMDARVRRVIRSRLDPEPFLALPEEKQLERVEAMDPDDLLGWHNSYLAWLEDGDEQSVSPTVLARILERIDEEEHSRYAQDAELDAALKPEALKVVREQRSIGRVPDLLALSASVRDEMIRRMDYFALDELKAQMEAYSHKHGRSSAWRAVWALVSSLLQKEAS